MWYNGVARPTNFYPRSPRGERHLPGALGGVDNAFLSTLPARGATLPGALGGVDNAFLSTLPARGASRSQPRRGISQNISIHAPREGSDGRALMGTIPQQNISIHAPREGSDQYPPESDNPAGPFLSTLPARGATPLPVIAPQFSIISIHAPREGSDTVGASIWTSERNFYPRSPRGERRHGLAARTGAPEHFYPRSPRGERHCGVADCGPVRHISIHAPREGSDLKLPDLKFHYMAFLSTLPARGATRYAGGGLKGGFNFYPRSPRGERRRPSCRQNSLDRFLSTLPARGATSPSASKGADTAHFYPRSPRGERPTAVALTYPSASFLSTLPARGATVVGCIVVNL